MGKQQHLLSAFYFFFLQVILVIIILNIRGAFSPPNCRESSPTLANRGQDQFSSLWYYEHLFDHKVPQLRILTEKQAAAPLRSKIPQKQREITIVIGTSKDRLGSVESIAMTWGGALSLGVHVLDDADIPPVYRQLQQMHARVEAQGRCRLNVVVVKEDGPEGSSRSLYPVNGMRNMAWRMATTKLIFLLDADFLPSPRMHEILTEDEAAYEELERKATQERHMFVVPAFEFMPSSRPTSNLSFPETQKDLKKRWQDGTVDCFHCSFSPIAHDSTNLGKFFDPAMTTPYSIPYMEGFEPYIIVARESTPMYDERFRGYGKNKISHVYNCARGHDMPIQVLPNIFVFEIPHPQSQSRKLWGVPDRRVQNMNRVFGLYNRFKKEVQQTKAHSLALEGSSKQYFHERAIIPSPHANNLRGC